AAILFVLWFLYLSIMNVGQDFLSFQWDILLLEAGFLAIFLAPWRSYWPIRTSYEPPRLIRSLLKWLLFRLMLESGLVKILSHDPTWRDFTALQFHYETQPLPTWLGWYAHQLPLWFQKCSVGFMFFSELIIPFFYFAPGRFRRGAVAFTL